VVVPVVFGPPPFLSFLPGVERVLRSVANLTRADGEEFLALAPQVPVRFAAVSP
jgi:propanol-preferring alcohol dehydrogenase